jgi:tetratricopeptide (TPR) repeat protein
MNSSGKFNCGVLILFLTTGCGGLTEREVDLFEQGSTATEAGHWRKAVDFFSEVIEANPEHGPSYVLRGKASFELGEYHRASKDFVQAEATGGLSDEELYTSILYRGRCIVEQARAVIPDTEFASPTPSPRDRRDSRDLLLKANLAILDAMSLRPQAYDAHVWRGYVLLRLENYRKALDTFTVCQRLDGNRWEHLFFSALAWEGLYKVNSQSLENYFSIIRSGPRPELAPVYEYLVVIHDQVAPEAARKIFAALDEFARAVPDHAPQIDDCLAKEKARQGIERRQARLRQVSEQVTQLVATERFRAAVDQIEAYLKEEGEHPEMAVLLRQTEESWSQLLEARTESLMGAEETDKLQIALMNFELARKLTNEVDRLVALQQKINALQLALTRRDTSRRIEQTYELLKTGRFKEVLRGLENTSLDGLSERDKDLYHYIRGVASYSLGQWTSAVKSFSAIQQRNFDDLNALNGLALIRSGQHEMGVSLLVNLAAESRTDEVDRVLGHYFLEKGKHLKAVKHLAMIRNPGPADLEAHLKARRKLGLEHYGNADYRSAIEEFQAARKIVEVELKKRAVDVYLYLGNSHFFLEDYGRAKKTYQDLSDTDLTTAEREQCRELFLRRGQIHLRERNPDLAYADMSDFVRLGGQIPVDLANTYGRLVATYANFMPLETIRYWNYVSTARDYNYTLFVKDDSGGEYRVERREAGATSEEVWSRQGIFLSKQVGDVLVKIPINLKLAEEALPFLKYVSQGQECTAEIVAIQQTVELPGGQIYTDCLKVRVRRTKRTGDDRITSTKHIFFLAPNVGEVKQEVYRGNTRVSMIVLSDFALKSGQLGN